MTCFFFWTSDKLFVCCHLSAWIHGMEGDHSAIYRPPMMPAWKWPDFRFLHTASATLVAHCTWVCCTSLSDSVNSANPTMIKVISNTTQHVFKIYGKYTNPEKIAQKNKPTWKQVVMVADWLRFPRVLTMVVGLRILTHKIDTGSPFPRGESPPRHPPSLGFIPPGRTKRQFCSDLWNDDIKSPMLLDDQAPLIGSNLFESNVRPERKKRKQKTPILRYLKFYLSHAG